MAFVEPLDVCGVAELAQLKVEHRARPAFVFAKHWDNVAKRHAGVDLRADFAPGFDFAVHHDTGRTFNEDSPGIEPMFECWSGVRAGERLDCDDSTRLHREHDRAFRRIDVDTFMRVVLSLNAERAGVRCKRQASLTRFHRGKRLTIRCGDEY